MSQIIIKINSKAHIPALAEILQFIVYSDIRALEEVQINKFISRIIYFIHISNVDQLQRSIRYHLYLVNKMALNLSWVFGRRQNGHLTSVWRGGGGVEMTIFFDDKS